MYIRTKDGVYKVSYLNAYATHKRKGETLLEGYKTAYIKNENIIAQSENLDELCDCFETVADYAGQLSFTRYLDFEQARLNMSDEATLYGYIYIVLPNGAIRKEPIAKMNDKGDLELI